ncbi:putative zinc-binding metallopeptidase [Nocardioides sp. Kera G14]|uniref:zinc-binding metallopeptidase family protein n=1 Tax=Nocardioides sp. Kera G14 TaxID=2884264 RepID=UPI001D10838F|nr:putative zinc-binding metallopeptidase [Nocardioides sp. Kera G14]UDY23258.1 putative zinc-binding peptidase [Nocardioides sp. Kera G14]
MKAFRCRACDNPLYFENSVCVSCGTSLGFSRAERAIVPVDETGRYVDAQGLVWWVCSNLNLSGCTWLAAVEGGQCEACDFTRTRPADEDTTALAAFLQAEQAKRYLLVELDTLGFPIRSKVEDPEQGLCFDLLASANLDGADSDEKVVIGHDNGVITIDLAESDPVYREKVRESLDEPYRTMLGHFRHEVGHYIEWQYVVGDLIEQARELFGDERESYADAIERHYAEGAPAGWEASYLSTYATMHPFEDFAETFAHYLHISDTIESAGEYGLTAVAPVTAFSQFRDVVTGIWVPLSIALNVINRSMGKGDLYPFVIPPPVLDKLDFVAALAPGASHE